MSYARHRTGDDVLPRAKIRHYDTISYSTGHRHPHNAQAYLESDSLQSWGEWRGQLNEVVIDKAVGKHGKRSGSGKYATVDYRHSRHQPSSRDYRTDRHHTADWHHTADRRHTHGRQSHIEESLKRDPSQYMKYALASNNATELSPEEFLKYGIPRAKINKHNDKYRGLFTPTHQEEQSRDKTDASAQLRAHADTRHGRESMPTRGPSREHMPTRDPSREQPPARTVAADVHQNPLHQDEPELAEYSTINKVRSLAKPNSSPDQSNSENTEPVEVDAAIDRPAGWSDVLRDIKQRVPVVGSVRSSSGSVTKKRETVPIPPAPPLPPRV